MATRRSHMLDSLREGDILRSNFNDRHPELRKGERFDCNSLDEREIEQYKKDPKRRVGKIAYAINGQIYKGARPVFFRRDLVAEKILARHPEQREGERFYTNAHRTDLDRYMRHKDMRVGKKAYDAHGQLLIGYRSVFAPQDYQGEIPK